jgi:glycosyltransferase involved in cell wall biosynthesis
MSSLKSSKSQPLVSVIMLAYNFELYIDQAIQSVLDQEVNFNYELIIGEDCSTDNTRVLVQQHYERHPEIIKLHLSTCRVGAIQNEERLLKQCYGKYIAFLEGDDYWTDPLKLQKQVDFLEANPNYGLVHGDVNHLYQKNGKIIKAYNKTNKIEIPNGDIFEFLIKPSHSIKTMTVCLRKELFDKFYLENSEIMKSNWAFIDISIWLMFAYHSKIYYFDEVFATYRLLPESASRIKNSKKLHQFHQKIYEIFFYYANNYSDNQSIKKEIKILYNKMIMNDAYNLGDKKMAKKAILQLEMMNYNFSYKDRAKYFIYSYLKKIINR